MLGYLSRAYTLFILPKAADDEWRRREFILNVILVGSLVLSAIAFVIVFINATALGSAYTGESPVMALAAVVFFAILLTLSRIGLYWVSAYIIVMLYLALAFYSLVRWGILLPEGVLVVSLALVMASILLGTTAGAIGTVVAAIGLIGLAHLQKTHAWGLNTTWMKTPGNESDAIGFAVTLGVITTISWLSNREIERSLARARRSEEELKHERDMLDVKVRERTRQLEAAQKEKIIQLSRFAEFGRLTSGIVHELVTPITTVSFNLEQMHDGKQSEKLKRAIEATKHMERYIQTARRQLQNQSEESKFVMPDQIEQSLAFLTPQAKSNHVNLEFIDGGGGSMVGNPVKFSQIISNLVSNAIEAYPKVRSSQDRRVEVALRRVDDNAQISVRDWGAGIPKEFQERIFEPFFTLKKSDQGMGIGLSLTKEIVERDYNGHISVSSNPEDGTVFVVKLALQRKRHT